MEYIIDGFWIGWKTYPPPLLFLWSNNCFNEWEIITNNVPTLGMNYSIETNNERDTGKHEQQLTHNILCCVILLNAADDRSETRWYSHFRFDCLQQIHKHEKKKKKKNKWASKCSLSLGTGSSWGWRKGRAQLWYYNYKNLFDDGRNRDNLLLLHWVSCEDENGVRNNDHWICRLCWCRNRFWFFFFLLSSSCHGYVIESV